MAASRLIFSDPANDDLDDIWDCLAAEGSPEIADFVIARLFEAMHRAADNPKLYRERTEFLGKPRRINVFEYAIFYELLSKGHGVLILRVIHGRRDLARRLLR